ncbi:MAG TPA: hypothetical protein VJR26_07640 [Candidatus Acidoferrales bacterium]|nr:hypothetical protein [Candidatus Acidoferrales bacterium]
MKTVNMIRAAGPAVLICAAFAPSIRAQQPGPMTTPPPAESASEHGKSAGSTPAKTPAQPAAAKTDSDAKLALPAGTHIPLVLHNAISTRSTKPGDPVYFETIYPVILNGKILVPAGSWVNGIVTEARRAGRVKGRAEVMMRLTTMILPNAYVVSLVAGPSNAGTGGKETTDSEGKIHGDTDKANDAGTVIDTTVAGAGIGAIASQSARGAGLGAGIGAAAGLATVLLGRGPDADLPRGTTLDAVLDHTIMLDAGKINFTSPGQASALPGPPSREQQRARIPF